MTENPELRTVYEWRICYEDFLRCNRPTTRMRYLMALDRFFDYIKDEITFETCGDLSTQGTWWIRHYLEDRLKSGASARTVRLERSVLSSFLEYIADNGGHVVNVAKKVKLRLTDPTYAPKAFGEKAINDILGACESDLDRLLVLLVLTTGFRVRTLSALAWSDIDLDTNQITLDPAKVKRARGTRAFLRADVKEILVRLPEPHSGPIFGVKERALADRFRAILERAGRYHSHVGLHAMRRTFATLLHRNGMDLKTIQELLGHRNIATTALYLSAADEPEIRAQLERLPRHSADSSAPPDTQGSSCVPHEAALSA